MRWPPRDPTYQPQEWTPFFCLLPRCVNGTWVWLETIERFPHIFFDEIEWKYRLPRSKPLHSRIGRGWFGGL